MSPHSIPSPAATDNVANHSFLPQPTRRPNRLLRNAISQLTQYCETGVPSLFPQPDLSGMPNPELGIFIVSDLTEKGEAMVRQALELSARIEIDTRYVGEIAGTLSLEKVQLMQATAISTQATAQHQIDLALSLLGALSEVAAVCFESLLINEPTDLTTTEIDAVCVQALAAAGVNTEACVNPGKLYQAVCVRFNALERLVMELTLQRLKADLHLQRLDLLQIAGNFLSRQAKRILDTEFLGNDDFLPGHHHTEIELTACADNPFLAVWPNLHLSREERQAEQERIAALARNKTAGFRSVTSVCCPE